MTSDPAGVQESLVQPEFPRQLAETRGFSCGVPRGFTVSPDGARVLFCRSSGGTDPVLALWLLDLDRGEERPIAHPDNLGNVAAAPAAGELARRERLRERSAGITDYSTDADVRRAVFAVAGRLWCADVTETRREADQTGAAEGDGGDSAETGGDTASYAVVELPAQGPVIDPRISPCGRYVAYVAAGALRFVDIGADKGEPGDQDAGEDDVNYADSNAGSNGKNNKYNGTDRVLAEPEAPEVTYGLAEFIAAEEMGRTRGYWWSPDGERIAVTRVDESAVQQWYVADPAHPEREPTVLRYPMAGSRNAVVQLRIVGLDGRQATVEWGWDEAEYLAAVQWSEQGLFAVLQNRAQTVLRLVAVDPDSGLTTLVRQERDPAWVPIVAGVPTFIDDGSLVWVSETAWPPREPELPGVQADTDEPVEGSASPAPAQHLERFEPEDTRRLLVDGRPVTPAGLQVHDVCGVDGSSVLFTAADEPTDTQLWRWSRDSGLNRLSSSPGLHHGCAGGGTTVVVSSLLREHGVRVTVTRKGAEPVTIPSYAETPQVTPAVELIRGGDHQLRVAVLFPTGHVHGSRRLPVLLAPYGGPAGRRVVVTRSAYLQAQWYADQGFCVVIADGRGTPGRGPAWDRTIGLGAEADLNLEDQIQALQTAAERFGDLDVTRVAIRGWSHGGWLAALAVLRRPDIFHAAVAGAPVTDKRLYSTHYSERYLGHPDDQPTAYDHCSLLADAPSLRRPLMLVHGLADDNVLVAHTLRLSAALTDAGRPHTVLPLVGSTHMPTDPAATANLAALQVEFLRTALAKQTADPKNPTDPKSPDELV